MNSAREYRLTYQDYLDIRREATHIKALTLFWSPTMCML